MDFVFLASDEPVEDTRQTCSQWHESSASVEREKYQRSHDEWVTDELDETIIL